MSTHTSFLFPDRLPDPPRRDPALVILPPHHPDTLAVRKDWAHFLDRIEELDDQVGTVFADLEEDGVLDDTFVFFFSDHGGAVMRGKRFIFESRVHVPLIVWFGKNYRHLAPETVDGRVGALVSFVDFAPTVLNLIRAQPGGYAAVGLFSWKALSRAGSTGTAQIRLAPPATHERAHRPPSRPFCDMDVGDRFHRALRARRAVIPRLTGPLAGIPPGCSKVAAPRSTQRPSQRLHFWMLGRPRSPRWTCATTMSTAAWPSSSLG